MTWHHNTFSIVARDPAAGDLGIAISSRPMCVGSICPAVRHGVGAIATQAWTNPYLPERIFARLEAGEAPEQALAAVMADEVEPEYRQVGVVDVVGRTAAFTGDAADAAKGHRLGDQVSIQGNMLRSEDVLDAMAEAYASAPADDFARRLLAALAAGQRTGGDARGERSAALKIVAGESWPLVDLRVDLHGTPVQELIRLYDLAEVELLPFRRALPTRANPRGRFDEVRTGLRPKPGTLR